MHLFRPMAFTFVLFSTFFSTISTVAANCAVDSNFNIATNCSYFDWSTGNVTNNFTISGLSSPYGAVTTSGVNLGSFGFTNNGDLVAYVGNAAFFNPSSTFSSFTNAGTINGGWENYAAVTNFHNLSAQYSNPSSPASITAIGASAQSIYNGGTITQFINDGTISGVLSAVNNFGSITNLTNSGTLSASNGNSIVLGGQITGTLNNSGAGLISGTNGAGIQVQGTGSINTLSNTGTITGSTYGITNSGSITTLNNSQGTGNINGALTYSGILPTNYNIIINSPTLFGALNGSSLTGSSFFGIDSGSTLATGTYSSVLNGFTSANITNYASIYNTWNNFNSSYKWELVSGGSNIWNIVVASLATNITGAGTIYQSSNLGASVNPVFDGGTLQVSSAGTITQNFTVNVNNGVIDQNGVTSTFSGVISDATGSSGGLAISNTGSGGSVVFSNANTYTGPTTINSGATLSLSGDGSITNSSSVTNNGTFNITGKATNVTLGGAYSQGSSGTLSMSFAPINNQRLIVPGSASLSGALYLNGSTGSYSSGRYTLLTANGLTGSFNSFTSNLSSYTTLGYALTYNANNVYLVFTPNLTDTQTSIQNTASALQGIYTLQSSVLANSFSYDCNEFGANNICVSAGGRNTAVSASNGLNNTSALLIAAYRPHPNYRIGAYADQNLSVNNAGSTVNLGNNTPLVGVFGAWNERLDGTGSEVKVSAAYGQKNTTVTRQIVGTSEAGSGGAPINSQGAQVTSKYGFGVMKDVIVSPYVGVRFTQNNMNGYTEASSSSVTTPLTYNALNTNTTTLLAGLGASYRVIPQATLFASAGIESDTNTNNGTYQATGLSGLTAVNFNSNPVKNRATATLAAYYDIEGNQRFGITGIYRQEPYQAIQTTTVMATYTIGI